MGIHCLYCRCSCILLLGWLMVSASTVLYILVCMRWVALEFVDAG